MKLDFSSSEAMSLELFKVSKSSSAPEERLLPTGTDRVRVCMGISLL